MNSPPPNTSGTPTYRPALFLLSGPGAFLTSEELIRYFDDFYASLEYVNTAPQMVFERLIGNLSISVHAIIEKARRASEGDGSRASITGLEVQAPAILPSLVPPQTIRDTPVSNPTSVEQEVRRTPSHVIRSFSVQDCAEWDASTAFACTKAYPTEGKADLSRYAIALTSFHIPASSELIASASITTPQDTGFSIVLTNAEPSGYASRLKSASCSLLEIGKNAPDMQCGEWSSRESQQCRHNEVITTKERITFPMVYDRTPQVLVWLRGLYLAPSPDRSLSLRVVSIDRFGFSPLVTYLSAPNIRNVEISWLAYYEESPGLCIGTFHTGEMSGRTKCDGYLSFERRFKAPPSVAVGITAFNIDTIFDLSLSVQVLEVTSHGMKWRIQGGEGGTIKYASGSFIAFE